MAIVQVSYRYGYTDGSGRVINNGTDINARCVGEIRYANWGLSSRTSEMLIKNFVGAQLPFLFFPLPSSLLLFLLPLFSQCHLLSATAKESMAALKLVSRSGRSARQTTFSEFWVERVLLW